VSSVFLSHNHKDKPFVRRLAADLRRNGHIVWIDEAEIEIGDSLVEKIRDGIDKVDYVAAILSNASLDSEWVKKELDIATNIEIEKKKVVVLPIVVEDVELPGFLKGKFYGDFKDNGNYENSLALLLRKLGKGSPAPEMSSNELEELRKELKIAEAIIKQNQMESEFRKKLILSEKSPELTAAIEEENIKSPQYSIINEHYAFEAMGFPITIGYALHSIRKVQYKGSHILSTMLSMENKWPEFNAMMEAFNDYLGFTKES
jgi:hypothetical protein